MSVARSRKVFSKTTILVLFIVFAVSFYFYSGKRTNIGTESSAIFGDLVQSVSTDKTLQEVMVGVQSGARVPASVVLEAKQSLVKVSPGTSTLNKTTTVVLSCEDSEECDSFVYSINGEEPVFVDGGSSVVEKRTEVDIPGDRSGIIQLKYRARNKFGDVEDVHVSTYEIIPQCEGNAISETGTVPCVRVCGLKENELEATADHRNCSCVDGFEWVRHPDGTAGCQSR